MAGGPSEAASKLDKFVSIISPPVPVRQLLLNVIVSEGWFVGSVADDKADLWLSRFVSRVAARVGDAASDGSHLPFCYNSSGTDYIQGSCFVEPGDNTAVAAAKASRAKTHLIYQHCLQYSPNDFEKLSGKILELLEVQTAYVSQRSADQGIDFFGCVPLGKLLKPNVLAPGAEKNLLVWLVGQSKHYPTTRVGTAEIRELVGSVELAKAKIYAGRINPLSEMNARLCDPVIYLIFTTGRFTRDSVDIMRKSGVLAFDGLQISQFLADHSVGLLASGEFDAVSFDRWLNGQRV